MAESQKALVRRRITRRVYEEGRGQNKERI